MSGASPADRRGWLAASLLWLVSLAVAVVAFGLGELGAPKLVFVLLLGWLATFGLPTTLALVALLWAWPGWPLWAFCTAALVLSFVLQVLVLRWRWRR